ncbi:cytochrome P450 2W1 [Trichechus manatus latirostris]|uniref:Cytochrome P450 2W1 n=1 Tax=Trichechus manatus latirostris TaxID=127582 RepID=A0A2Y9E4H7_TRIMA|nr:cytochrome P450 2W1 [Trichechus manatus latirostris]
MPRGLWLWWQPPTDRPKVRPQPSVTGPQLQAQLPHVWAGGVEQAQLLLGPSPLAGTDAPPHSTPAALSWGCHLQTTHVTFSGQWQGGERHTLCGTYKAGHCPWGHVLMALTAAVALLLLGLLLGLLGLWGLCRAPAPNPAPAPRWPPGPRPLPLVGNLHLLDMRRLDRSLMELAERYGPVFTVHLGHQKTVVLTGFEAVRAALVGTGQKLADRPLIPIFQHIQGGRGIFFSSGPHWRAARQFTVRALHGLGMGRAPAAHKVLEELEWLVVQLDSYGGRPFPLPLLGWAPSNITFTLLFGQRFDYQDPLFVSLLGLIDEVMVLLGSPGLQMFNVFPQLGAVLQLHRPVLLKIEEVRAILKTLLEARRRHALRGSPVQGYVDALIQQGQGEEPLGPFSEADMVACTLDMVMAGTETTSATLQWAVLLMVRHPRVQGRTQAELDRVLGLRRPRPDDQAALPYTNAVLHEVQRYITLLPHVPRCATAPTRLGAYLLPKGTPVIPLLTSVLLDKTQWETPEQFNPGHFLDADGRFVKRAAFLPFSAGRRVCVGESLARTELFLLFAGLLQRFRLQPPPGDHPAALDDSPAPAFTMRPRAQALCAVPRRR